MGKSTYNSSAEVKDSNFENNNQTFHATCVLWFLSGKVFTSIQELKGASEFIMKATLKGGRGDCAWQHAQLFRQSINEKDFPFDLQIKFD